jgi:RNA polymerase sigma-70 factor (ECF subfamily)
MRETTLTELERVAASAETADVVFVMDEDAFRGFYGRTSRALWGYLARVTGDRQLADDLMQETYYRFLRAAKAYESEAHRRNSLFHIATNLVRDSRRRPSMSQMAEHHHESLAVDEDLAKQTERRADLERAMGRLKPRERMLLWLAYAEGESHRDIANALGLNAGSVKQLLFRARRKLAETLRGGKA